MKKSIRTIGMLAGAIFLMNTATYAQTVNVGGEAMFPKKNIVENAVKSKDHTTLVAAVTAADLVATLQTAGPLPYLLPLMTLLKIYQKEQLKPY